MRLLAYVTGSVNQELLLRNEYLAAENRILRAKLPTRLRLGDPERAPWPAPHIPLVEPPIIGRMEGESVSRNAHADSPEIEISAVAKGRGSAPRKILWHLWQRLSS